MFDTRAQDGGNLVWRRRECNNCHTRWSTREYLDQHPDLAELDDILESTRVVHKALGRTIRRIEDYIKGREAPEDG